MKQVENIINKKNHLLNQVRLQEMYELYNF